MTKQLHLTFQPTHQHTSEITIPSLIPRVLCMGEEGLGMRLYHTLFNCQSTVHLSIICVPTTARPCPAFCHLQ